MYWGNHVQIGNKYFSKYQDIISFLKDGSYFSYFRLENIESYMRADNFFDQCYLNESLAAQCPNINNYPISLNPVVSLGPVTLSPISHHKSNPNDSSHWYKISDMIEAELLLAELDALESIKYCSSVANASTWIAHYKLESQNDKTYLLDYNRLLKYASRINDIDIDINDKGQDILNQIVRPSANSADIHGSGGRKKGVRDFLQKHEVMFTSLGLHKKTNRYYIPIYELHLLLSSYALSRKILPYFELEQHLTHPMKNNESLTKEASYYLLPHQADRVFSIYKLNTIFAYYNIMTSNAYLERFATTFPHINNPSEFLSDLFFNFDFISNYLQSDWKDCFIFIKNSIDCAVKFKQTTNFPVEQYLAKERDKILQLMSTPFRCLWAPILENRLGYSLSLQNYNIESLQTNITAKLLDNHYFQKYYGFDNKGIFKEYLDRTRTPFITDKFITQNFS